MADANKNTGETENFLKREKIATHYQQIVQYKSYYSKLLKLCTALSLASGFPLILSNTDKICSEFRNACSTMNLNRLAVLDSYLLTMHLSQMVWVVLPLTFCYRSKQLQNRNLNQLEYFSMFCFCVSIIGAFMSVYEVYMNDLFGRSIDFGVFTVSPRVIHTLITLIFIQVAITAFAFETMLIKLMRTTPLSRPKNS